MIKEKPKEAMISNDTQLFLNTHTSQYLSLCTGGCFPSNICLPITSISLANEVKKSLQLMDRFT